MFILGIGSLGAQWNKKTSDW